MNDDPTPRPPLEIWSTAESVDWLRDTIGTGPLSGMFYRSGTVVHTPRIGEEGYIPLTEDGQDGPAQVRRISHEELTARVQYTYRPFKIVVSGTEEDRKVSHVPTLFPTTAARTAVSAPDMLPHLRRLKGVTHTPIVRADGSVLDKEGYDPATRLLYIPEPGLVVPPIPAEPNEEQLSSAVELLLQMIEEFPFITKHDQANYLGVLVTPLLRELTPPPYKLIAINAHQQGSGKSYLAKAMRTIHGGVFRSELPDNDELRKMITTTLEVTTGPVVQLDNVTGVIRSGILAGMLTSGTWSDRRLGGNEMISARNDRLWVITGNNIQLGGDIPRRTLWCSIDPGTPEPWNRRDFKIDDFEGWVQSRRGDLLSALLTLVRAWVAEGRPTVSRGADTYRSWIEAVDGILKVAGIPGTFDHAESVVQTVGTGDDDWRDFLMVAHQHLKEAWTSRTLLGNVHGNLEDPRRPIPMDALPGELAEKAARLSPNFLPLAKSLGKWLANREGRWCGDYRVVRAGEDRNKVALWKTEQTNVLKIDAA